MLKDRIVVTISVFLMSCAWVRSISANEDIQATVKKETIRVGRLMGSNDSTYLKWLKDSFEKKYARREGWKFWKKQNLADIVYEPPLEQNGNFQGSFQELLKKKRVDVVLGGAVQFHRLYASHLEPIKDVIEKVRKRIPDVDGKGFRWIAYYGDLLGLAWDMRCGPDGWQPKHFSDLYQIEADARCIAIPKPGNAGARDLLVALGMTKKAFSQTQGTKRYQQYFRKFVTLDSGQPSADHFIASGNLVASVVWPHDSLIYRKNHEYDCIGISIPDESSLNSSAISLTRKGATLAYAKAFIEHALSEESQEMHFQLEHRLPSDAELLKRYLSEMRDQGGYVDASIKREGPVVNDARIARTMRELIRQKKSRAFKTKQNVVENQRGCQVREKTAQGVCMCAYPLEE